MTKRRPTAYGAVLCCGVLLAGGVAHAQIAGILGRAGSSAQHTSAPAPLADAGCVGNCNSDASVTVDELLVMINVALGVAEATACAPGDANHDGAITVDEILRAINYALDGCPTSPGVAGTWSSDDAALVGSDCGPEADAEVELLIGMSTACTYDVTQQDSTISITNCNDVVFAGTVDPSGTITAAKELSDSVLDCQIDVTIELSVDASHSPTTANFDFPFHFSPACEQPDCTVRITTQWTRE